jgi:hypothetical protein
MNILKSKGPKTDPYGTPERTSKCNETYVKCVEMIADQ